MRAAIALRAATKRGASEIKTTHGGRLKWTREAPPRRPKVGLGILTLITVGMVTGLATYTFVLTKSDPSIAKRHNIPEDVSDRYVKTAKDFDKEVGTQEVLMGLNWLRWWLVRQATGNVLEVSVGTGRNASYYDEKKCKSITMLDLTPEMIEIARLKFKRAHPFYKPYKLVTQSALDPIDTPQQGFDTIVQTMGICSTPDPVKLLSNLGLILNPGCGRILLLEHGKSHYDWLNRRIDNGAPAHADVHGCWPNKDIGKIVEESGLEIVEMKRYHFGTTWWYILKLKEG